MSGQPWSLCRRERTTLSVRAVPLVFVTLRRAAGEAQEPLERNRRCRHLAHRLIPDAMYSHGNLIHHLASMAAQSDIATVRLTFVPDRAHSRQVLPSDSLLSNVHRQAPLEPTSVTPNLPSLCGYRRVSPAASPCASASSSPCTPGTQVLRVSSAAVLHSSCLRLCGRT